MKITCVLSPPVPDLKGYVAVVIDALRATSTLSIIFGSGAKKVYLYEDLETAKEQKLYNPKLIVTGEEQIPGTPEFYNCNSVSEFLKKNLSGKEVAFITTNGTSTIIQTLKSADKVLVASMLNLSSTADELASILLKKNKNLAIVCSGANGWTAIDDVYVAGALFHKTIVSARLRGYETDYDGITLAKMVHGSFAGPMDAFVASESGKRLSEMSMTTDIALCAKTDLMPGVLYATKTDDGYIVEMKKEDE